jgi:gliding motility-associated-like protein
MNRVTFLPTKGFFRGIMLLLIIIPVATLRSYSQVNAGFNVSDNTGCMPLTVHFTNTGSGGAGYSHEWYFGNDGPVTQENPQFTFNNYGTFEVRQVVTNINTSETDTAWQDIIVVRTPGANLNLDLTNACVNGDIKFGTGFSQKDSALLDFGDGHSIKSISSYIYHSYEANGIYDVTYITYFSELICSDTSHYSITIAGPVADFSINPIMACRGEPIEFTMNPVSDVDDFSWELEGGIVSTSNPVIQSFDTSGYLSAQLMVSGGSGTCTIQDTFYIYEVTADFSFSDIRCDQEPILFYNSSYGNDLNFWDFGNGQTIITENPSYTYPAGEYSVKLIVQNVANCKDSVSKTVIIHELPEINMGNDITICPNEAGTISVTGGDVVTWSPEYGLDDPQSYAPLAEPDVDTIYTATITDTLTRCSNSGELHVYLQEAFLEGMISVTPAGISSVIIGDSVQLSLFDSLNRELVYTWQPDVRISCIDCPSPMVQPLETTTYIVEVYDDNECRTSETFEFIIEVREEYRIGIPDAFTPNGDGINETIKVDGWGIKELIEFRVFNRSGKEVFYTTDFSEGWDGYCEGRLQMTGTYLYSIKAEMWDDKITTKTGTFSLLR